MTRENNYPPLLPPESKRGADLWVGEVGGDYGPRWYVSGDPSIREIISAAETGGPIMLDLFHRSIDMDDNEPDWRDGNFQAVIEEVYGNNDGSVNFWATLKIPDYPHRLNRIFWVWEYDGSKSAGADELIDD